MPDPILPLVKKAIAEDQEVVQDVDLATPFSNEGYANVPL